MNGYSSYFSTMKPFLKTLANANQEVFKDIYWQFLFARVCGGEKVIKVLAKSDSATDLESLKGWRALNDSHLKDGNLQLLRVEQEFVLQPLLYGAISSRYFSFRKTFNHYAVAGAPGKNGPLKSFDEYSKSIDVDNNLAILESRMEWVNYLVMGHAEYFQEQSRQNKLSHSFSDIRRVYSKIIDYYEQ